MRYHEYLRDGLPIASGSVEGACKNLVKDRMERSGMLRAGTAAETPQPASTPPMLPPGSVGFLVSITDGDGPRKYVIVAHDLSSAVAKALVALRSQHPEARISDISRLGRVLG